MAGIDVFTGQDLIEVDGKVINDFANGKCCEVRYPNDIANIETGKDRNSIITLVANGERANMTLRLMIGNNTDQYLSLKLSQFVNGPASYVGITAKLVKMIGDGTGQTKKLTWNLENGVITKNVEGETDTTGDVEQGVAVYNISFTRGTRTIGN